MTQKLKFLMKAQFPLGRGRTRLLLAASAYRLAAGQSLRNDLLD